MRNSNYISIILAAGKGSRIKSKTPKVMLKIKKKPLILSAIELAENFSNEVNLIVNKNLFYLKSKLKKKLNFFLQSKPLGTGHAVREFFNSQSFDKKNYFLILYADTPFVEKTDLIKMKKKSKNLDIVILGFKTENNQGCGLIKTNSFGYVEKIIEYKNSKKKDRNIDICNSGVMMMNYKAMRLLNKIKKNKLTKEFYLTDIIQIAKNKKLSVGVVISKSEIRSRGINDLKTFYRNVIFFKKRFK